MPQTENQSDWEKKVEWVGIVAGCIIKKAGKYLLVQEKQARAYGLWNLPSGLVDKGETIEEAAVREVREETGYIVRLIEEVGVFHESVGRPVKHIFSAKIADGKLTVQEDEIVDVRWFSYQEIKALKEAKQLRRSWVWDVVNRVHKS